MSFISRIIKRGLLAAGYSLERRGVLPITTRQLTTITYLRDMYALLGDTEGAIVECGVGRGRTFLYFTYFAEKSGASRMVWGFDSFEGFPEPTREDTSSRNPKAGEWSGTSPDDIKNILRTAGISHAFLREKVRLVKGFFEQSLGEYDRKPIALLHVDVDLYQSYKTVLDTLVQYVAPGGLVLFDEYGEEKWPGGTKAIDEFIAKTGWQLEKHTWSGKYFCRKPN